MAPLSSAPLTVEDAGGAPRFGTYEGNLDTVDLSQLRGAYQPGLVERRLKHKKWVYGFVATQEVAALFCVVDVGYSSNAFAMAVDLTTQEVLADGGFLGPPRPLVQVSDVPAAGLEVGFRIPGARFQMAREPGESPYSVRVRVGLPVPLPPPKLLLDVKLLTEGAAPPLTVIAPVDGGVVNVTQKSAGLVVRGRLEVAGRRWRLDGGVGGLDYTNGYLARRTAWRWAFGCGRLQDGTPLGLNLVEGFNEAREDVNENALWIGRRLVPLGRARFVYQKGELLDPWRVTTTDGAVDLTLKPIAAHREDRDLVLVKSRFAQPVGLWSGTIKVDGVTHRIERLPGVAEDQDVTW